ncbi:MAG TPA: cupin domain-containing protein [Gammaproteobacteria bacterium]|jgi:mannose-6-phosphate isomerase-like protein (cupin superfamily)|nr:cupin domain-containing protein [Gammaproteobacteria bacterium]
MSIARIRVEPGVTTRWHALHNTLERYLILQGHGRMETGQRGAYSVSPGDWVTIPADVRQRITNTGDDDLVFLAICSPRFRPACYRE